MKTTKELLSQIKDTILNGSEEQATELLREFVKDNINEDRKRIQGVFHHFGTLSVHVISGINNAPIKID